LGMLGIWRWTKFFLLRRSWPDFERRAIRELYGAMLNVRRW
jgi:hypothetical protein